MKVAVIGAGIAGLSAGCYLRMNGFEVDLFEMHSRAGGLCTSWKKGGYTFNGSLHWLMGSNESSQFYKLWSELTDMDSIDFYTPEIRLQIETSKQRDLYGNSIFTLYTNLDRLQKYLLDLAPEDAKVIRKFIRQIRRIQRFEIPPKIKSLPQLLPWYRKIGYARYLPLLFFMKRYGRITSHSFASRLSNPFLKEAFELLFDGDDRPILIHTIPLAYFDRKGAGYPLGGAAAFSEKIAARYLALGGRLHLQSKVEKILTEEGKAVGLRLADDSVIHADYVISAADWRFTVFEALDEKFTGKQIQALGAGQILQVFHSVFFLFLGLDRPFPGHTGLYRFPLTRPLASPDGTNYDRMEIHVHNYDPSLAPEGKSVVSVCLYTLNGEYWIRLRESDKKSYSIYKEEVAQQIIDRLEEKFGGIREHIEQIDVSSPATFHRFTYNWKGSIQGWLPARKIISPSPVPVELPGLQNFYMAGHWTSPGGGLPVAVKSAREAVMMICHDEGMDFKVIRPGE